MSFSVFESLLLTAGIHQTPASALSVPKKFLLVGTHAQQTTGYSKVTYNIIKYLSHYSDIQIFHFGFQKFFEMPKDYRPYPPNVDVYDPSAVEKAEPSTPKESGFGFSQLPDYIRKVKPDVVFLYNDAGIICSFLEKLESMLKPEERTYKLVIYLDQVYVVQRPDFIAHMDRAADAFFAFTNYWRDIMKKQGVQKPIYVLRHGFDQAMYKPMNRLELRKKHNIPANMFLMLNLNRNTPRKRYDLLITAFAELVARYPTKPLGLLCVTDTGQNGGFPIHEIYARELIKRNVSVEQNVNKLMITQSALTYPDEVINELYAMSDIGVTASEGEGFGLCQFEAMGVGVPQVVPDVGGFKDFCRPNNSVLIKPTQGYYLPYSYSQIGGYQELVDPADLCLGIEEYLLDSELREKHGAEARKTVLQYSWAEEVKELARVIRSI